MSDNEIKNDYINTDQKLDTDLSGMTPENAQKYVLAFITDLKNTQKKIEIQKKELSIWEQRLKLAKEKNKTNLIPAAQEELIKIKEKIQKLKDYENELLIKVPILKDELENLLIQTGNTINFEELLLQMQMINENNDAGLKKEFEKEQIKDELERLKKDIK